jgi:uncharacterized protein
MAPTLFINPEERRLRAGWRLLIQGIIFVALVLLFQVISGIVASVAMAAAGEDLTDPAVIQALANNPYLRVLSSIGSVIAIFVSFLIAARWLDRRPITDFGFHLNANWWADFGFGLVLGALLMAFIFAVELAAGWITITGTLQGSPQMSFWPAVISWLIVFICVGIYEEMLSRGYHLRNLAEGLNLGPIRPKVALLLAYLISSSIFGVLHASNPNATLMSTVNLIVAGLFLGWGYLLTGELAIPIALHITWNFFQGNVFGFPVSGMETPATFVAIQQGGPDLWTGGAFGPEAGLIGLVAIALGFLLTWLWVRLRYGKATLQERLAIYRPRPAPAAASELAVDAGS